jgi:hypothetical protein
VLELIEEALDAVALLVDVLVIDVLDATVALRRDNGRRAGLQDAVVEAVGVIGAVGQDMAWAETFDQVVGAADVVFLARRSGAPRRPGCRRQRGS